jgi:GH24 family phage-related lysozyme (muramidase)
MADLASLAQLVMSQNWSVIIVFAGMLALQWRIIGALDRALERQQAPAEPPPTPPKPMPGPVAPKPDIPTTTPPEAHAAVVDPGLVAAVKKFEGFSAKAYPDFKQYSIGYGTKAASSSEVITEADAESRLAAELAVAERSVEAFAAGAPIGVKQALTSLTYNSGPKWESQTLGELIRVGNYAEAKTHFLAYNHAGGAVNAGLTARRETEVAWFDHPL